MSRNHRRARRGQALVETALGLIVFVSILVWGIHFAELGFLAPKVHEAAANALWDTTAKKMHNHPNKYGPRTNAINSAGPDAKSRYSSFDGRSSKAGGGPVQLVFTRATNMDVTCEPDRVVDMSQRNLQAYPGGNGGMACHASAKLEVINFPKRFLDQGGDGFFSVKNYPNLGKMTFCSMGKASGGNCDQGKIAILLDDWGLSGGENQDNLLDSGGNDAFHGLVENVYGQTGAPGMAAGYSMASRVVGMPPPGRIDGTFWMSYQKGKPDPEFTDGDEGPNDWMTNVRSGSRNPAYKDRGSKWLGL